MKKTVLFIVAVIGTIIIFSACKPLFPLDKDQFDLNDTVTVSVGEKVYENANIWVRLDSITRDNRSIAGVRLSDLGGVEAKFSVNVYDSLTTVYLSTDSLMALPMFFGFDQLAGGRSFVLALISVEPPRISETEIPQADYRISFVLEEGMIAYKPNIYLYPKGKTKMSVSLNFPQGGRVVKSDPQYPAAWQKISVKPNGEIDGKHDFLFYEASLPVKWQYDEGWSVPQTNLESFFIKNLKAYGFNDAEVLDFIEYWIPRLKEYPIYNIYPQHTKKINEVVTLNISKKPKSVLRMFYVIEPTMSMRAKDILAPGIPTFERKGFTVTEWGVVFK